jgi:peptidoglycan/LPS O-acetylase OafA/YrhL
VATFFWIEWLQYRKIATAIVAGLFFCLFSQFLVSQNSVVDISHFAIPSVLSPFLFIGHSMVFMCSIVLLYSFGDLLGKSHLIARLGRHSMGIFLISQLVNQALLRVFSRTLGEFDSSSDLHIALAAILVVAVIAISWGISEIFHGVRAIRLIVFPRDIGEWSVFRKNLAINSNHS